MRRPSIDEYYMAMLPLVAGRGTCPRRQVACLIVDAKGILAATGYNGVSSGVAHCDERPCPGSPILGGPREACHATHAELNAVLQAAHSRLVPRTAYCSLTPCKPCAQALLGAGVKEVVAAALYAYDETGLVLLNGAGVDVWVWRNGERTPWSADGRTA